MRENKYLALFFAFVFLIIAVPVLTTAQFPGGFWIPNDAEDALIPIDDAFGLTVVGISASGSECLQIDATGSITATGSGCGGAGSDPGLIISDSIHGQSYLIASGTPTGLPFLFVDGFISQATSTMNGSLFGTALEIGRGADNNLNFTTDNEITFDLNAVSSTLWNATSYGFNVTTADIDFVIDGANIADILFIEAATDRIGIGGTTTPGAMLAIAGDLTFDGFTGMATGTLSSLIATSTLYIGAGQTDLVVIDGRVGVGTSTPGKVFAVQGSALMGSLVAEGEARFSYLVSTSTTNSSFAGALDVTEAATSTFTGGLSVGTGGLLSSAGLTLTGGDILSSGLFKISAIGTSTLAGSLTIDEDLRITGSASANCLLSTDGRIDLARANCYEVTPAADIDIFIENGTAGQAFQLIFFLGTTGSGGDITVGFASSSPILMESTASTTIKSLGAGYSQCGFKFATSSLVAFGGCNRGYSDFR